LNTARRKFLKFAGYGLAAEVSVPRAYGKIDVKGSPGSPSIYGVREFGAVGDGKTIDTPAINKAIEAASNAGGGRVYLGAGIYLCYSIHLRSNVAIYLEQGAIIQAADTPMEGTTSGGYDAAEPNAPWDQYQDFGHSHWHNSLIWGENIHDVSILGPGLIWGKGLSSGGGVDTPRAEAPGVGNKSIALKNCHNVLLRDFSILKGGHFGILVTGVDNLTIDNLKIDTNRDGIDIDCCRNVRVSNCSVNSPWDDAICPKSSFALGYARTTENITISNCYVTGTYELGTLLDGTFKKFPKDAKIDRMGRIKLGTESNGGFKNITISNCIFEGCWGLALETVDGALLEDISVTNITMRDIVGVPLFLRLGSRMRGPKGNPVGQLRRVLISNIVCSNIDHSNGISRLPSILVGIPGHCIEDIKLSDIFVQHQGGGTLQQAAMQPPELETTYPDPDMFASLPALGFYLRHVRNIDMSHIEITAMQPDHRTSFVLEDVWDANFLRIDAPQVTGAPMFSLRDVEQFNVFLSRGVPNATLPRVKQKTL
jgi:polygalacturonase